MDENKKYYYEQYILNCLENANEQQAKMIYVFAYYHTLKNGMVREPNCSDKEWLIIHQIFDVLERNNSEWFLRKALTRIVTLEKVWCKD